MKTILTTAAALITLTAGAAFAQDIAGDPAAGEKDFKKCKACHAIVAPDGEVIVKGGKIGPDLWGVVGRPAGSFEGYKYTEDMMKLGEEGLVWTPEEMAAYIPNAKEFLKEKTGDSNPRTQMTPQKLKDVNNVIAYLAQFGPDAAN